jgi:hypothetical protein
MFKIKIKKKNKKILLPTFILAVLSILVCILGNNHLEMILITIGMVFIFRFARFSYFTVFSFILWFSYLQEYIASINPSLAAGRLMAGLRVPVYHTELFVCMMYFFITELIIFSLTNVIESEREMYKRKITLKRNCAYLFAVSALSLVFLAYPSLPSLSAKLTRDEGIIPSSLAVGFSMLLLGIVFDSLKNSLFLKIVSFLTLFWILFHGDRVIVMGYLVYVLLKYVHNGKINMSSFKSIIFNKRTVIIFISIIIVLVLAIRIQITREGMKFDYSFNNVLLSLIKQGTAGDVVYAFNGSVDMWKSGNCVGFIPYMYYISNIIPNANHNYYTAVILINKYNTMGGGLFFTEPMISGGMIVTFIHSAFFLLMVAWVYCKKNEYHSFLIIPFSILIFRFAWYASCAALVKMFLYYVPLTYLIAKKVK